MSRTIEDVVEEMLATDECEEECIIIPKRCAYEILEIHKTEQDRIDKIRAEIAEEKEHAYTDFERYKVEYLGQDWEDALDSLPQDDYRYGMERAIEIIDKYNADIRGEENG